MRTVSCCLVSILMVASFSGCCCPPITAAREAAKQAQSANNMHQLGIAMHRYRSMEGKWAANLEELEPFTEMFDELITNPVTGDYPGYEYIVPEDSPNSATAVVLYQLRNGQRDLTLDVLYGDGHVGSVSGSQPN